MTVRPVPAAQPVRTLLRLRPVVHAAPTPRGIALRGWHGIVNLEGSPALWSLWQALADALADGVSSASAEELTDRAELRPAVAYLVEALTANDLLVELPSWWDAVVGTPDGPPEELARWLEAQAAEPVEAWERLRSAPFHVQGHGPVAASAVRALRRAGVTVLGDDRMPVADLDAPSWAIVATTDLAAVRAEASGAVGTVTPVVASHELAHTWEAVRDRLSAGVPLAGPAAAGALAAGPAAIASADSAGEHRGPAPVVAALVGGAAAHRMLCWRAGLPDPADQAPTVAAVRRGAVPQVFVVRPDPLAAGYHPWVAGASRGSAPLPAPPESVRALLDGVDALWDPELGSVPEPMPGEHPQVPLGLATCGDAIGTGLATDTARLNALLAHLDRRFTGGSVVATGGDRLHANGRALRRLLRQTLLVTSPDGPGLPAAERAEPPNAVAVRRWWKTLTLRFGVDARLALLALDGLVVAEVTGAGPVPGWADAASAGVTGAGQVLGWAVEADAESAALAAIVAAVGAVQAAEGGLPAPAGGFTLDTAGQHLAPRPDGDPGWSEPGDLDLPDPVVPESTLQQRIRTALGEVRPDHVTLSRQPLARAVFAAGLAVSAWTATALSTEEAPDG